MTPEQLNELERLNDKWANEYLETSADYNDLMSAVMDLLPDVLAHIKQIDADLENCNEQDGLKTKEINILVKENRQLTAERAAAERACAEMREALIPFQCETCNGSHKFTFECQSCLSGEGECTCDKQQPELCPQCQSDNGCKEIYAKLEHALSSDCGKGYHHDDEWKPVVEALMACDTYLAGASQPTNRAIIKQALSHAAKLTEGK